MSQRLFIVMFMCLVLLAIFYIRTRKYTLVDMPYEIDLKTGSKVFRGSVKVEGAKESQLYTRAKLFISKNFKDSSNAIKTDDKIHGLLIGNGLTNGLVSAKMAGVDFETPIEIHVQNGGYYYEISNMTIIYYGKRLNLSTYLELIEGSPKRSPITLEMNQEQYKSHMLAMKPFTDLIAQLRDIMAQPIEGNNL